MLIVWNFILAHEAVFSGFGAALLDLVFALNSSWASNGVLHWVYLQLQKLSGKQPPASS